MLSRSPSFRMMTSPRKLELTGDPNRLISTIPKHFHVTLRADQRHSCGICQAYAKSSQCVRLSVGRELVCYHGFTANQWALNSAVECHLHTVEVIGSNPIAPTTPIF